MHTKRATLAAALVSAVGLAFAGGAAAQMGGQMQGGGPQQMQERMPGPMGPGMGRGPGMGQRGGPGMGMRYGRGGPLGPHGMGPDMRGGSGMGRLFGFRVLPRLNLSVDDVKYYLDQRLESLGNDRLKLGEVKQKDANTITASIVTKDGSLVQALEVDRNTGLITYE